MIDEQFNLLRGALGLTGESIAEKMVTKSGEKGLTPTRLYQLAATGDEADEQRLVAGLMTAALAKGWKAQQVLDVAHVVARRHVPGLLRAVLSESSDPIAPYFLDLVKR
jgi:hypothetical protein